MNSRVKMRWSLFVAFPLSVALSGCLMTRDEIADEEQHKVVQQQVSSLQKHTADQQNKFSEINDDLRELHGKIENLDNRITNNNREHEKIEGAQEAQITDNNKKIAVLQEELQKTVNQLAYLTQEIVKLEGNRAAAPAAGAAAAAGAEKSKKSDAFKIAEESFNRKDWKQAILDYQKYRDALPNGKKFAIATFKIGLCFKELGMKDDAKTFFEEVQSKFPNTPLAKQAKDQLKAK